MDTVLQDKLEKQPHEYNFLSNSKFMLHLG